MRKIKELLRVVNELQSTNGKNDKETIIRNNKHIKSVDAVLRFLFDDNIVTGIKRTKLNKISKKLTYVTEDIGAKNDIFELMEFIKENNTGKESVVNIVLATADYLAKHHDIEITELVQSIICKDLKLGCSASTFNKANPNNPVFNYDVMAGKAWVEDRARKMIRNGETLYFTEKVDGNRGTLDQYTFDKMVSRNGKEWKGLDKVLEEINELFPNNLYIPDGEFVYNDTSEKMTSQEVRSMTSSIMGDKRITDKAAAGIVLKIFDLPEKYDFNDESSGELYTSRRNRMDKYSKIIKEQNYEYIQIIPVEFIITKEKQLKEVMPRTKAFIKSGKEGFMCISGSQPYKTGKGYQMMKLKNILSADLKIVGWNYGKEKSKWEGKFASFTVEFPYVDKKNVCGIYQVDVGMGYSDDFRNKVNEDPDSYIGEIIEILVTEVSKNKNGGYSLSYARMVEMRYDKNTIDLEKHTLVEIDDKYYFKKD